MQGQLFFSNVSNTGLVPGYDVSLFLDRCSAKSAALSWMLLGVLYPWLCRWQKNQRQLWLDEKLRSKLGVLYPWLWRWEKPKGRYFLVTWVILAQFPRNDVSLFLDRLVPSQQRWAWCCWACYTHGYDAEKKTNGSYDWMKTAQ